MRLNRFYTHYDRNGGHPSLIYARDIKNDKYKAVCFSSSPGKSRKKLKHSINPQTANKTYVLNQPVVKSHKNFNWKKELKSCYVRKDDKKFVDSIKRKK